MARLIACVLLGLWSIYICAAIPFAVLVPVATSSLSSTISKVHSISTQQCPSNPLLISNFEGVNITAELENVKQVNSKPRLRNAILKLLFNETKYENTVRPNGTSDDDNRVIVFVTLVIRNIENLDDTKMEYKVQLDYRHSWRDCRLAFGPKPSKEVEYDKFLLLTEGPETEQIWQPDIYFLNEKEAVRHEQVKTNTYTRLFPHGTVLQSHRLTLTLSCPMNLHRYPMDDQQCFIKMSSYGWTNKDMDIQWYKQNQLAIRPKGFEMPHFKIKGHDTTNCAKDFETSTGTHACIQARIRLRRRFGIYLFRIYIPCSLILIVSFAAFWLDPTDTDVRIGLGVTTILTLVTQVYVANQDAPSSSYIKASDWWTGFCQYMIFFVFMESPIVNYIAEHGWKQKEGKVCVASKIEIFLDIISFFCMIPFKLLAALDKHIFRSFFSKHIYSSCISPIFRNIGIIVDDLFMFGLAIMKIPPPVEGGQSSTSSKNEGKEYGILVAKRVDSICKIIFPLIFIAFNIIYWNEFFFETRKLRFSVFRTEEEIFQ